MLLGYGEVESESEQGVGEGRGSCVWVQPDRDGYSCDSCGACDA